MSDIELGKTYQDTITGFVGVATGHARYLDSTETVLLEPRLRADGTKMSGEWFPTTRLLAASNAVAS